LRTRRYP